MTSKYNKGLNRYIKKHFIIYILSIKNSQKESLIHCF
jgi:hypothetical protein